MVEKRSRQARDERSAVLDLGLAETKTLAECLAVDQAALARAVLEAMAMRSEAEELARVALDAKALGIRRQMEEIGAALRRLVEGNARRAAVTEALAGHPSDTVRGWAAFMIGRSEEPRLIPQRLMDMRPFAADHHFAVREWSWMAVRSEIAAHLGPAIACLTGWTADPDPNVRRFAVESTRPRGVWCTHIEELKEHPALGAPLLDPLCADRDQYVRKSVANWLNDASKSRPKWVKATCARWAKSGDARTLWIVKRALRTLDKKEGA